MTCNSCVNIYSFNQICINGLELCNNTGCIKQNENKQDNYIPSKTKKKNLKTIE